MPTANMCRYHNTTTHRACTLAVTLSDLELTQGALVLRYYQHTSKLFRTASRPLPSASSNTQTDATLAISQRAGWLSISRCRLPAGGVRNTRASLYSWRNLLSALRRALSALTTFCRSICADSTRTKPPIHTSQQHDATRELIVMYHRPSSDAPPPKVMCLVKASDFLPCTHQALHNRGTLPDATFDVTVHAGPADMPGCCPLTLISNSNSSCLLSGAHP
jgi:hypothetical protein